MPSFLSPYPPFPPPTLPATSLCLFVHYRSDSIPRHFQNIYQIFARTLCLVLCTPCKFLSLRRNPLALCLVAVWHGLGHHPSSSQQQQHRHYSVGRAYLTSPPSIIPSPLLQRHPLHRASSTHSPRWFLPGLDSLLHARIASALASLPPNVLPSPAAQQPWLSDALHHRLQAACALLIPLVTASATTGRPHSSSVPGPPRYFLFHSAVA